MEDLRVFYNDTFTGRYPVGVCAIVVARSAHEAACILAEKLAHGGIPQAIMDRDMKELPLTGPRVLVVNDGDY